MMDMDSMILEDVELEPEFPPARIEGGGGIGGLQQHLQTSSSTSTTATTTTHSTRRGDCVVSRGPALPHFQTTAKTGTSRSSWFHTPADSTATGSASWEMEAKQSQWREISPPPSTSPPPPPQEVVGADGGGGNTATSALSLPPSSSSSSSAPPDRNKYSTALTGSVTCLSGLKRTRGGTASVPSPFADPEDKGEQAISSSSSSPSSSSSSHKRRDYVVGFLTFLLCGVASLCCWQFLLALMPYIENNFFEGSPVGNSLIGVYQVGCICVQLVFMFLIESMQPWLVVAATISDSVLALIFPVVVSQGSHRTKKALTHLVALFLGVNAGMICGCCLAVASALPYNFIGAFSVGQGIAGILSFVIGLAFNGVFDLGSPTGLSKMLWLVYGTSCVVSVASACVVLLALRQPWAARQLTQYWAAQRLRESTSRWTIMWRRWMGQPQKKNAPHADASFHRSSNCRQGEIFFPPDAACRKQQQEGGRQLPPVAGWAESLEEDACAAGSSIRAASKQSMKATTGSSCDSGLPAPCGYAMPCTADATSPRGIALEATGSDMGSPESAATHGKHFPQGETDAESSPVPCAPDTMGNSKSRASADLQNIRAKNSDETSGDSENRATSSSCLPEDTFLEVQSRHSKERVENSGQNTFKTQISVSQISVCSRDATSCEQRAKSVEEEKHQPSRGWRYMLRDSGIFLVCVFLNFFVTLNLYPRVGPIMWHYPSFPKNGPQYIILFGVFCIGDCFGKSIVDISKAIPKLSWLMIPKKLLLPVVISRLGIAAVFLLGAYAVSHWFFNSFALYVTMMLLLAITNGWCATTSLLYVCTSVERLEEREILGPASVLVLQLGIMAGAWTALSYPMP